jgi:hypothetical protein
MTTRFEAVSTVLEGWKAHWEGGHFDGDLTNIYETVAEMTEVSKRVRKVSLKAARSCDSKALRKRRKVTGKRLARLYSHYYKVNCLLDQLKCVEIECGFFSKVRRRLDRAGYFAAEALRTQMAISISKENRYSVSLLTSIWKQQETHILAAEEEIKRWERQQFCVATRSCVETVADLRGYVKDALKSAARLEADPTDHLALAAQREVVDKFEARVAELSVKAGQFKGIRRRVFDRFSWGLVQTRLVLSKSGEGAQLQPPARFKKLFTAWKKLEATAKPQDGELKPAEQAALLLSKSARAVLRRLTEGIAKPPAATPQRPATPQLPVARADATQSSYKAVHCSPANVQAVWQQTAKLLGEMKVSGGLEDSKREIIDKIKLQQSWLANYALPGKVPLEIVAEHSYAQWTGIYPVLTLMANYTGDAAEGKHWAAQLAEQDSIMNKALGVGIA